VEEERLMTLGIKIHGAEWVGLAGVLRWQEGKRMYTGKVVGDPKCSSSPFREELQQETVFTVAGSFGLRLESLN
jgi:hypothetical protein